MEATLQQRFEPFDKDVWRIVRAGASILTTLALTASLVCKAANMLFSCRPWNSNAHNAAQLVDDNALPPELTELLEEKLLLARLERTRRYCHATTAFLGPFVAVFATVSAYGTRDPFNTQGTDVLVLLFLNFCILVMVRPGVMTFKVMEIMMCSLPVLVGMVVSPILCRKDVASLHLLMGNLAAIVLCLVRRPRNPRAAPMFYFSIAFLDACLVNTNWYFSLCGWANQGFVEVGVTQSGIILAALGCGSLCERSDRKLLTDSLRLQDVRELYAAASALLSYSFDVMVEVDEHGSIVSSASELSSLVLQPSRKLQGTQLSDLFTREADRVEFLQRLGSPHPAGLSLLESMAVGMQDSCGLHLRMELLWFGFCRRGSRCFMVGIREHLSDDGGDGHAVAHMASEVRSEPSMASGLSAGSGGSDEFSATGDWELCDSEPAVVTLNTVHPGCPVRAMSTSFILQRGRLPLGSPFVRCMKHPKKFEAWLQTVTNLYLHECDLAQCKDLSVKLQLHRNTTTARCSLVPPAEGETLDLENVSICLNPLPLRSTTTSSGRRPRTLLGTPHGHSLELGHAPARDAGAGGSSSPRRCMPVSL